MSETVLKPLNWQPGAEVGYTVVRRPDGGMLLTFTDALPKTLHHWRKFALEHLLDSDRLTCNLYDLRQLDTLPEEAIQYAVEVNNDPAARNIRLAVVAVNDQVRAGLRRIADLTRPGGVEMGLFMTLEEAETWLDRPLTLQV